MAAGLFAAPLALLAVARAADWYPGNGAAMSAPSAELYLPSPELLAQCGVIKTVKKTAGGDFTTIQDAVNSLNTTLSTNTCVVVTDAGTYSELVTVQNFLTNGNRLKIMKDPLLVNSPVLNAFGGLAGFQVRSASVTIAGINITAGGTLSYGIHVSSSHVLISSVNVTGSSFIDTAGIALSSWSVVENSSVSVQSANAIMAGGVKNEIRLSTMAASTMTGYALQLSGTSSNTVTGSYIFNQSGQAARLYWGSNYNTISNSTITSLGSDRAMYLYSASSNTFTNNYIYSQSGPGATLEQNSYFNRFSGCSVTGNSNSYGALYVSNSSSNTFSLGYIANPGGIGADLYFGAGANTISLSTITSRAAGFQALRIESNVLNSVLNSYIQGSTAAYVYNASSAAIRGSVLVSTWTGGVGLMASQSSLFVTTSSVAGGPGGQAIYVAANSFGKVELTSNTITGGSYGLAVLPPSGGASLVVSSITFQALLPGATAIHIYSGTNVYNLTAPRFDSPSIAVNINASAMTGGAVTVTYPAGPMASQYLANDPDGRVQWPWPYAQSLLAVGTVTINVGIGTVGALGYEVMASTADNYHVRIATATRQQLDSLTLSGLAPNTTYYVAAGALWDRTTYYYPTDMTPVTLIEEPTTVYIDEVGSTTIVASAYAPGAAFTGLERGLSGVNLTTTVAYGAWSAGGNSWTARTPVPFARHAHGSAALGGKIYVVAGTDGGSTLSYNREYDPVSFTWADKAGLPFLRSSLGLAAATGRLYAIGGFQGSAADANEEYDPEANTWRTRAPMPGGPRYGLSVVSFGGKVYAIGGAAAGVPKNTNEAYDPAANSWTTHTTMSTAREGVTAAVVNGRIYVMGGSAGGFSDKNEEYDPATFFWTTKTPMPSPREYAAAAAVGGKIYLLGGFDGTRMASNSEYDPATNAWVQLSTMSVGRNSHAAAAAGGKIYVSGGYNVATMSLFEEFNPGVSKVFSGLQPNTLYTFKAKARNLQGSETAESLTVSTYTLAAVALMPDGNTFENVYISSVIVRWSSGTAAGGYNGPNALYVLQGSTATDFTGTLTVNQGGNPVHMESLLANTTYHFRIKAYNAGGYTDDRWLSLGSTVTHIEAPTSVYIDEVGTTSIVASAYAPGAAFTGMERGLSAVNIAKDGAYGVWGSSGNYWNTKAAMPMPRVYLAAAALGGKIYAVGGYNAGNLNTNEEYDPALNAWTTKAQMGAAREYLSAAAVGGKLYALGGSNGVSVNEAYDPVANTWATKAPLPTARANLAAAAVGGKIYTLGGGSGPYLGKTEEYDPATDTWSTKALMLTARGDLAAAVVNNKIYAIGGTNGPYLAVNEEYDPVLNLWTTRAPLPEVRLMPGAAAVGGKVLAVSGYSSGAVSATAEYDPAADAWSVKASILTPRYGMGVAAVGGKVYALGGAGGNNLNQEYIPGVARVFTGLQPNTLYTFKSKARNQLGVETSESITVSTYTLAAVGLPANAQPIAAVYASSAAVNWSSGTGTAFNGPGASFLVVASTSPDYLGTNVSSHTYNVAVATLPLASNTSYYFRIQAYNAGGMTNYSWLALGSTVTLASTPAALPVTAVSTWTITAAWGANGNAPDTVYRAEVSHSPGFAPLVYSTSVADTWVDLGPLPIANTYYFMRVNAVNRSGSPTNWVALGSTVTAIEAPLGVTFTAVSSHTLQTQAYSAGVGGVFTNLSLAQSGIDQALGGGWQGWEQTDSHVFTGLAPNAPYAAKARARNALWAETPETLEFSTYTLATVSLPQAGPLFQAVYLASATVAWSSGTALTGFNGPGASYIIQASTAANFSGVIFSSRTAAIAAGVDLERNTSYYFRAQAYNAAGVTDYSWLVLGSTATQIETPSGIDFTAVTATSIDVLVQGQPGFSNLSTGQSSIAKALNGVYAAWFNSSADSYTGLTPNTQYAFSAKARNQEGRETPEVARSTWTLAATPAAAQAFNNVYTNTLWAFWQANGNPVGTLYRAEVSTAADFSGTVASSETVNLYGVMFGLQANTTYYGRVAAVNGAGVYSPYLALGSTITYIQAPTAVYADEVTTNSVTMSAYASDFTGLERGLSAVRLAKDGVYEAWGSSGNYWAAGASLSANTAAGAAAALGGKVHLAGGWAGGAAYVTHRAYDPAVNAWADRAPLLTGRHSLALAAAGNKLYAVGGAEGLTNLAVNEEYDPEANAWTAKAPMPTARKELAAAAAGGKIYALGGSNGSALAQNEEYDPAYNRWTARTPMPTARYGLAAAVIDGQVYASGGAGGLAVNEEYDPAVDAWVTRAPLLTGRYNHGAAAVGGKLYAVGGYNGAALALNESYDPATNNWTTAAPLPAARYKIAVAAAEGRVYALGGVYVTTNEVYDPGVALAFSGLAPNTQYSFKARARNQQGTETGESVTVTTYTLAAVALSETGTTFVEVFPSSVAVAWSSGTASGGYNGPNPSYKIQASTAPDFTGTLVTPHLYSPVEFEYAVADLASNTTYHFRIQAWNAGGFSDYRWLSLGTTVTHAIIPNAAAQPFDGVNQEGVTIQWGRNGNSEGTAYKLQVSSHTNFSFVHSTVYPLYASTTAIGGLTPNTTWYARAAAVSYSGVQTDYYVIGGTLTHSAAPSQVLFSAVSTRTVTVEAYSSYGFPNLAEGLSGINQAVGGVYAGWLQSTGTVFGGLAPNTSFAFKAKARNQTGIETAESLEFSTYTLATVSLPQQTSLFSGVWLTSVTVNWSSGTVADGFNGPGADHHVEVSRDVAFTQIANGAATYNLSWSPEGLWPNTTHYFKARAVNTALVANPDWLTLGSTSTLANTVPSASVFEVWPTTVTVDWAVLPPVPSSDTCEGYLVQASTATDFTGLIKSSATGDNALGSLVVLNLFAETTYYFRVGALNHNGVPNYALAGSTWTPSENIPPTINNNELATDYTWYGALPARTYNIDFHDTGGSALENFQVRATTGPLETGAVNADWMDILTGINADDYTVNWPLTAGVWALLADGTNYISVQVFDGSGNKAAAQDAFMVFKDTTPPSISETYDDQIWRSTHGFSVPTAAADPHSGINKVQYSARSAAAQGGAELIPWSQIAAPGGAKTAAPALPVSSGVWDLLQSGTNYFSLRAWDYSVPVNTNTWTDAFVILKDTTPPAAMTTLAVVAPSTYSLRVSFEAPAEGPSGIDMFGVQYATYAVAWATSSVAGSTHSYLPVYNVLAGEGQLADIVGLGPNTTYYFRAWARDQAGNWSAASNAAEGVTLAEAPQVLGSPDFYTSTAAIAWIPVDSNGYAAYASTASDFSGTVLSSATPAASAVELVVPGLLPGTTYYLKAASLNWSGVPNYTGTYTDSTFVVVPASAAVYTGVSSVSITVEWLSNGNGPGTQYFVDISSENFLSVMYTALVQPSGPGPHSREFTSMLQPNTTYWFQVLALGNRGDASDWLLLGSTVTAPVPPALTGYALWSSSAAVAWTSNGNGAGTLYQADLSTASDFSGALLSSSAADAFSFSMGVLTPNTTYYLRLRAVSAVTGMASPYVNDVELALAAEPASIGAWTVGANNIGVFWDADGNPGVTAQSAWQTGAALPAALYGHAGAIAGDFAFITGGYDGGTYKTAVWSAPLSADGVIGAWTQTRPLPGARYAHSSVAMRGRLYVIGGYDGSAARAEVWSAPISSSGALGEWVAEAPLPQAVYAHAFTAGENTLYVLGGYNNAASDDVWYTGVNPDGTLTGWTAGPALSEAVYSAAAYLAGPNIYLAGGYDGTTAKTAVWRSPVNGAGAPGAWLAATALPSGVFAHALDAAPGALFISGGTGGTFARASTLRGALNADGTIAGWHAGPDLPAARQSHLMFTRGSRLTVLGGYDGSAHAAGYYSTLAGTEYRLYATGAPFAQTPWQTAGWQDVGSLTPNSSYVFRPAARNYAGLEAVGAATCSTFTYAAQPGTAAISGVYISSMQANWLVADNPAGTLYQAQLSSDGAHTQLAFSSATANAYALFAGIEDDYAYYARVRAVNAVGVATAWTGLGWAATRADPALDFSSPTVTNNQAGDNNWRKAAGALYDLDFADMGGSYLDRIEVRLSTAAGGAGPFSLDWTAAVSGINAPAYADNWALPAGAFELLAPGTSYVSVRAFDGNGNSTTTVDAFYILKDTVAPVITNYQAGEFDWRMDDAGPVYDVDFADGISGLGGIEYSASPNQGSGDAAGYPWTAIAALSTAPAAYNGLWAVDFAGLPNDATNYISVRAWDLAGNTVTVTGIDVFRILKYVAGPETAITAPAGAYVSALTTLGGTASDARSHALAAVEVSLREVSTGKYWDGADFLASSVKWFVAAGTAAWSHAPGITWLEGSAYQAVARSSDTAGNYSLTYATRSFTFDSQSPVIGPTAPADGGNVNSVPAISGTAYDLSGLSALALRLSRLSDGKWWDFGAGTWTVAGSSATVGASGSWSYAPGDLLRASLEDGASYYYTLYAADNSVPARSVAFGVYGSTFGFTDDTPPAAITDLTASTGSAPGNIQVNWTSPGDDGASGMLLYGAYRLQYSTMPAVAFSTADAQAGGEFTAVSAGSGRSKELTALVPGETYYLRAWTLDDAGNWSALSNGATAQASPFPDRISGRVMTISSAGITGVLVEAYDTAGLLQGQTFTVADGSGSYAISGLPSGSYRIQATWTADDIVSSVGTDGVALGASNADFLLSITYDLASIGGELPGFGLSAQGYRAAGARPRAASVELYQRGRLIATAPVDAAGRFLINNLLPGKYTLRVPKPEGGVKELAVSLKAGEALRISPLGDILRTGEAYAYPNPASRVITFRFETDQDPVLKQLAIFDITGRLVHKLADGRFTRTGAGPFVWKAEWEIPSKVASGVYVYTLHVKSEITGEHKKTVKKFAIVK